ncbi:hypothetical protein [Lignipirellula cremea]|uniref:hypothetical protein n=1 Tax=Lignipirellula cremea TaxID=2528010 RepID=UPI00119E9CB0|nr:hypothetical protein [Lignipirellula cremea]
MVDLARLDFYLSGKDCRAFPIPLAVSAGVNAARFVLNRGNSFYSQTMRQEAETNQEPTPAAAGPRNPLEAKKSRFDTTF